MKTSLDQLWECPGCGKQFAFSDGHGGYRGTCLQTFVVEYSARKVGSIGTWDDGLWDQVTTAAGKDAATDEARSLAYANGYQHVRITAVREVQ